MNNPRLMLTREEWFHVDEALLQLNRFLELHGVKLTRIGGGAVELEATSHWQKLAELRDAPGESVAITWDNDDGPPNHQIECTGEWTGWREIAFQGDTMEFCLNTALMARREFFKKKDLHNQSKH